MKKIALSMVCLALGAGAVSVSPAQEAAPAGAVQDAAAQDAAVRAYSLNMLACMLEGSAEQIDMMGMDPISSILVQYEKMHAACAAIPTADLPEEFQAYLRESNEISKEFVEEFRSMLPAEGEEITEELQKELAALQLETQVKDAQLETKYPAVAAKIGKEAFKDFTDKVTAELQLKEKALEWAEAHKEELEAKGPASMADVLRYLASEVRKAAEAK